MITLTTAIIISLGTLAAAAKAAQQRKPARVKVPARR